MNNLNLLIAPFISALTSYLINVGIDVEHDELKTAINVAFTLLAGAVAHVIATRKAKK